MHSADCPNPVILTASLPSGGVARFYANGMVDAINGPTYSVSPGFDSLASLLAWEEAEETEWEWDAQGMTEEEWMAGARDEFSHGLGEIDGSGI